MRSGFMMVTNIIGEQSLQMAFIQCNNVVQELSSATFHPIARASASTNSPVVIADVPTLADEIVILPPGATTHPFVNH